MAEVSKSAFDEISARYQSEKSKLSKLLTERNNTAHERVGRILHCHLILENYLYEFLAKKHPTLKPIMDSRMGGQFGQKMELYKTMGCTEFNENLYQGLYKVNEIRNKLGHGLAHDDIEPAKANDLLNLLKNIYPKAVDPKMTAPLDILVMFTIVSCTIIHLTTIALDLKLESDKALFEFIDTISKLK